MASVAGDMNIVVVQMVVDPGLPEHRVTAGWVLGHRAEFVVCQVCHIVVIPAKLLVMRA